ncbi:hypothetical protein Esti_005489 [Eimeria stiedai]
MADLGDLWVVELEAGGLIPTDIGDPEAPLPQPHARLSPTLSAQNHQATLSKNFIAAESTWQLHASRRGDKESWQQQEAALKERPPARLGGEVPTPSQTQQQQPQLEADSHGSNFWPVRVSAAHPVYASPQLVEVRHPLPSSLSPPAHASSTDRPTCNDSSAAVKRGEACGTSSAFANSTSSHLTHSGGVPSSGLPSSEVRQPPPQFFPFDCPSAAADLWSGCCSYSRASIPGRGLPAVQTAQADPSQSASKETVKNEGDWWWQLADKDAEAQPGPVRSGVNQWTTQTRPPPASYVGTSGGRGAPPRGEGMVTQFDSSERWPSQQASAPGGVYVHLDSVVVHSSGGRGGAAPSEQMPTMLPMLPLEALRQLAPLSSSQLHGVYEEVSGERKDAPLHCGQLVSGDVASYASSTTSCGSSSPYTSPISPAASAESQEASALHLPREELEPRLSGNEGASWQQQQLSCLKPAAPEVEVGGEEDYGPWCSAAVVTLSSDPAAATPHHQASPPLRRSRSSSNSNEDFCGSDGSWLASFNQSNPLFTGRSYPLSASRRRQQHLCNRRVSRAHGQHVQMQFDEDEGVDGGFLSIQRPPSKSGVRTPHARRSSLLSFGTGGRRVVSRVNSSIAKMYDRLQQQLEKQEGGVEGRGGAVRTPELKLEVEELRKRRLAEPMRQRLLRQYTEHLRKLDAAKAEAVRAEERPDKIRPLLVKVAMAASKLRCLQSSESWREYVGAAVTDVDADLSVFMNNFGVDPSTVEVENEGISGAAAGNGICGGFWKGGSVAGAFMALMLLYLVVIAGAVFWLQQTGTTNSAFSPPPTKQQSSL